MENLIYEYKHDKSTHLHFFQGLSSKAPRHFHRSIEILYVTQGEVGTTVDDESFVAVRDEIIFVHRYYVHSFMPKTEYKKYVLIIPARYEGDVDKVLKSSTLPPKLEDKEFNRREILPYFERLVADPDLPDLAKKGYVSVIIGMLFSHYPTLPIKTPVNIELMVDVLKYIDDHSREPLTLDSVASHFGYNKYYFSRMFNKCIGESIVNYINVVRLASFMREAKGLENPQISRLAAECGFESMPTFYRSFIRIYGESPKTYFAK